MSAVTNIEWCDSTFNPWIGCTKVSLACDDCYAARSTPARTLGVGWGPHEERRRTSAANWAQPRRWNAQAAEFRAKHGRRQRVFCASLADVFDNQAQPAWRADLFELIQATPHLDWLLLTKRIGNAWKMMADALGVSMASLKLPPPNVWLGSTVVNQEEADRDIPKLLAVPAAKRFLSVEPMLGRIYIEDIPDPVGGECLKPLAGLRWLRDGNGRCETIATPGRIDWVICGGESGPKARPMHPDWARSLRDQCEAAGVPFLFKQWGEWLPAKEGRSITGHVLILEGAAPFSKNPEWHGFENGQQVARVGKKAAGRQLDGRTHDGFPEGGAA